MKAFVYRWLQGAAGATKALFLYLTAGVYLGTVWLLAIGGWLLVNTTKQWPKTKSQKLIASTLRCTLTGHNYHQVHTGLASNALAVPPVAAQGGGGLAGNNLPPSRCQAGIMFSAGTGTCHHSIKLIEPTDRIEQIELPVYPSYLKPAYLATCALVL